MKFAILLFHKNIINIYKKSWIIQFIDSINNQSYKNFDIIELNYDENENIRLFKNSIFINKNFDSHYDCKNYLLDYSFNKNNYDYVMITNIDDFYDYDKIKICMNNIKNYDIVSNNIYIYQNIKNKEFKREIELIPKNKNSDFDINWHVMYKLEKNINIIENSGLIMSKKFYLNNKIFYDKSKYPFTLLDIWKKSIKLDTKINIINQPLTYQRIHSEQLINDYRNKTLI